MEIIIKINIDDVNKSTKDSTKESNEVRSYSQYARFFDESSPYWHSDPEYNLMFLRIKQENANARLKSQGYLFLNDVYAMLGIPRTKSGQLVGWVYDSENVNGDNYVDFGLYDENNRQFVNEFKRSILLDFNVDGLIFDKILD